MQLMIKTSIVCGVPTRTGKIYTESLIEQAFEVYLDKFVRIGLLDLSDELPDWPVHLPVNQIAFEVCGYHLDTIGRLFIVIDTLNTDAGKLTDYFADRLLARCFLFSPKWVDDDENKVVDDLAINGFTVYIDD